MAKNKTLRLKGFIILGFGFELSLINQGCEEANQTDQPNIIHRANVAIETEPLNQRQCDASCNSIGDIVGKRNARKADRSREHFDHAIGHKPNRA